MAVKNYAHVTDGLVTNVIVLDDDTDPAEFAEALGGGELVPLDAHEDGAWGIGWRYENGQPVPPPRHDLISDRDTIPADGTAEAVVTYTNELDDAPAEVTFVVDGEEPQTVALTDGAAELSVTSEQPRTIEVSVDELPGVTATITAEEV